MEMHDYFSRFESLIGIWVNEVDLHTQSGSTDKNKYSEYIAAELLNAVFPYRLEVLRMNHPAVDLGDADAGIAFQITSRTEPTKIKSDLETFKKELTKFYPKGMRFLLLTNQQKKWTPESKKSFNDILQGFDAENHIYTFPDIVKEMKVQYLSNPEKFHKLLAIMEWQFGNKTGEPPLVIFRDILIQGSRDYYEGLRGEYGRFRMLHIEDTILTHPESKDNNKEKWVPQPVAIEKNEDEAIRDETILTMLPRLWGRPCHHVVITGEGGMGKTVSLVRMWEKLLNDYTTEPLVNNQSPIPLFIALNEYNHFNLNTKDFIQTQVLKNYLDNDSKSESVLLRLFKTPLSKPDRNPMPAVVLFLDGFNEITVEKQGLMFLELKSLLELGKGVQIVMTSRYDMRPDNNWGNWNLAQLQPLDDTKVETYLKDRGMTLPEQKGLKQLIQNPMMLTLYAASCEDRERKETSYFQFKDKIESPGELLYNFMEAQVARLWDREGINEDKMTYYRFLLRHLLPALGYEMQKEGLFDFTREQVQVYLNTWCSRFGEEDFFDTFPDFGERDAQLPLGSCRTPNEERKRATRLRNIFCKEIYMLVEEDQSYRFLHQNFRDFFAAVHILNEMEIALKKNEIAMVLKERVLNYFNRQFLGEIEEEHHVKSYFIPGVGWKNNIKANRLHRMLELCRGKYGEDIGYAVWNIVEIWKQVRGELGGEDFSRLDLSGVNLNGIRCSYYCNGGYLAANFEGSRLHEKNVLIQGHREFVSSAVYRSDGKRILSASYDHTIKEWDAETGECRRTLSGHEDRVTGAVYRSDGKFILSASADGTIKEWDAETGECRRTLSGHEDRVTSAVYRSDGKRILSASVDGTIKEWDAEAGEYRRTFSGHQDWVTSAVYRSDGKFILSASVDGTIKEWDAETGECRRTLSGHEDRVISAVYRSDGKCILSTSWDKTIKEWNAETGKCIRTLSGHDTLFSAVYRSDGKSILSASVDGTIREWDEETKQCSKPLSGHKDKLFSAVYRSDGKRILSALRDGTIKEWDAETGQCIKTLSGHQDCVNSAVYRSDRKRILSASDDHTIKEWDAKTGKCIKIFSGHKDRVSRAIYCSDEKRILSDSWDKTIKEWDAETGQCLHTYDKEYTPNLPGYEELNNKLYLSENTIHVLPRSKNDPELEIINVPGLFIQGCSFQNLEKGSQWTEEGLNIMKQYCRIISIAE
ncbi:MAG: SMEK domain-containing protein [Candidatus Omnitrophota bacterium]